MTDTEMQDEARVARAIRAALAPIRESAMHDVNLFRRASREADEYGRKCHLKGREVQARSVFEQVEAAMKELDALADAP